MPRTYKIRRFTNGSSKGGKEFTNYSLTVPANIASQLSPDILYECSLTDEGILFRPSTDTGDAPIDLPAWAIQQEEAAADEPEDEPEAAPARRSRKRPAKQAA